MSLLTRKPEELLPHAAPMVLLDELEAFDGGELRASYRVRADDPLVLGGALSPESTVEHMAQAVGCAAAMEAGAKHQRPKVGLILGTRTLRLSVLQAPVGSPLTITARRIAGAGSMGCFACRVQLGDEFVAEAELNVLSGGQELLQK